MLAALQIVTILLVALAAALSVAHALEYPGKLRLDEQTYRSIQPIYYPGFTVAGGVAEPLGVIATVVLLWFTPRDSAGFWFVLGALAGMIAMHAIFWTVTQPVNRYWVDPNQMNAAGRAFFQPHTKRDGGTPTWTELRDRWEYSHIARAVCASVSLLMLLLSIVTDRRL